MRSPSVPKIDAEGDEPNVLAGATELLWYGRAKDVSTEAREDGRTSVQEGGLPRLIRAGLPPPLGASVAAGWAPVSRLQEPAWADGMLARDAARKTGDDGGY